MSRKSTLIILLVAALAITGSVLSIRLLNTGTKMPPAAFKWEVPDTGSLGHSAEAELIRYGRELVANTSYYLGPKGKVAAISNGMNCQNCHLEAGTRIWGNNFSGVYSMYPMFRQRSGSQETIYKRISDCIERSLNGKAPDSNSKEMQAIRKYIEWVGKDVPHKTKPPGAGLIDLPLLDRAADPSRGKLVYINKCQRCHGADGEGLLNEGDGSMYIYPPLWGENSYNVSAGLFRLSRFAGYVKANMPFDKRSDTAMTVEESWDVAAFVNSQPRPQKKFVQDWPNIAGKPFDYPFGPYADRYSETQHKFGPFGEMRKK